MHRVELPDYDKSWRVVFSTDAPPRLLLDVMSFQKRPACRNPRRWATAIAAAGTAGAVIWRRREGR